MDFRIEKNRRRQAGKPWPAVVAAVLLHLGVFGLYMVVADDHEALFGEIGRRLSRLDARWRPDTEISGGAAPSGSRLPWKGPSCPAAARQKIYSWKDGDGVPHYATDPPHGGDVRDLRVTDAFVPDELGYSEKVARAIDPAPSTSGVTRVLVSDNQVLVPVRLGLDGREVQTLLVLDTGASTTVIYRPVSRRLGLQETRRSQVRVADGRVVDTESGTLDYVAVGPHRITDVCVSVVDHEGDSGATMGLLGMNYLRQVRYRIDFRSQTIHWQ
jgi:predicted aspartyl protease